MARVVLVPWSEVMEPLADLAAARVEVGEDVYVPAEAVIEAARVLAALAGPAPFADAEPAVELAKGNATVAAAFGLDPVDPDAAERARLAALPHGDCYICKHADHFDGQCPDCGCDDYQDSVIRDPAQARLMSGGGPGGPIPEVEPGWSPSNLEERSDGRLMRNGPPVG